MSFKTYQVPLVTSSKPVTGIDVAASVTLVEGVPSGIQLALTPEVPDPAPEFTVTSSDSDVVAAGLGHNNVVSLLGIKPGSANVTIVANGISKTVAVTVEKYPDLVKLVYPAVPVISATALTITADTKQLTVLQQFDLSAIVTPYNFNVDSVDWQSSDSSVAKIADIAYVENWTGIYRAGHTVTIRGMKAGTATITASIGALTASCIVTVI